MSYYHQDERDEAATVGCLGLLSIGLALVLGIIIVL